MITISDPWFFILLPLPLLIHKFFPRAEPSHASALKVPFFQRLVNSNTLVTRSSVANLKYLIATLIWILLIIAVAGPTWLGDAVTLPRQGRNIFMAIDLSGSMSLPDFTYGGRQSARLDVVKKIAGQFIDGRMGDRIGLIVFGSHPYVRSPLTYDLKYDRTALDDASIGLAGQMTAIGDAIGLAVKRLQNAPASSRVLILLTDGGNNAGELTPIEAARLAKDEHIKIYTIGIGADRLIVPTMMGPQVINPSNDLDEDSLREIAKTTGGAFFRAKNTEALQHIYKEIDKLEPVNNDASVLHPEIPLYPWPLGLALLLTVLHALHKIIKPLIQQRKRSLELVTHA